MREAQQFYSGTTSARIGSSSTAGPTRLLPHRASSGQRFSQRRARATRATIAARTNEHFLARLASRAPRTEVHPEANGYLALLDRALLDRQISRHEADELVSAAQMMGISREGAMALHRHYL